MGILAAGQALRSCAASSRGGKDTTTATYYSSSEGLGLGSGEGNDESSKAVVVAAAVVACLSFQRQVARLLVAAVGGSK
jgi:hypothetical protein